LPRLGALLAAHAPPPSRDWHKAIVIDGENLGNGIAGDCVPAGALRGVQIMRAVVAGDQRRPNAAMAYDLYRQWAGWDGVPGSASDIGTPSDTAAALWASKGIRWADQWLDVPTIGSIDPTHRLALMSAIDMLGPAQLDLDLPASAQGQDHWTVTTGPDGEPGSWGAHRVCAGRYDPTFLWCISWGMEIPMTWDFVFRYGLNAEACVSRSWLDTRGLSPEGLDLDGMKAAMEGLAT
jgi:hypothetical protein